MLPADLFTVSFRRIRWFGDERRATPTPSRIRESTKFARTPAVTQEPRDGFVQFHIGQAWPLLEEVVDERRRRFDRGGK
jgi:hypothetical protein